MFSGGIDICRVGGRPADPLPGPTMVGGGAAAYDKGGLEYAGDVPASPTGPSTSMSWPCVVCDGIL